MIGTLWTFAMQRLSLVHRSGLDPEGCVEKMQTPNQSEQTSRSRSDSVYVKESSDLLSVEARQVDGEEKIIENSGDQQVKAVNKLDADAGEKFVTKWPIKDETCKGSMEIFGCQCW